MSFSWKEREEAIQSLPQRPAELLILGGGVVGCSIAAHAAALGLDCVLIERADLASGASGNSTGLAHAGLRYLAQGRVRYVLHEARERLRLEKLAPHWVRPFRFLFPVYQGDPFGLFSVRIGTALYDGLYRWAAKSLPNERSGQRYRMVGREEILQRISAIASEGLKGGTEYFVDARLSDGRFTLGFAQKAAMGGARILPYTVLEKILESPAGFAGVLAKDVFSGQRFQIKARLIINATGAWIDSVRSLAGFKNPVLQNSKGIHLIVDRLAEEALILSTRIRGQVFFIIPIGRRLSLVGTTDTAYAGDPDQARPTAAEVQELIANVFRFFPTQRDSSLSWEQAIEHYRRTHIHEVYWGLRPLLKGKDSSVSASREHRLLKEAKGLWSVPGVKLTAGRAAGEEVAKEAWRFLRRSAAPGKSLGPLPGGEFDDFNGYCNEQTQSQNFSIPPLQKGDEEGFKTLKYLVGRYGTRYKEVLSFAEKEAMLRERVLTDEEWFYAEVPYAVQEEMVLTLNDFLWRRTRWARLRELPESALWKIAQLLGRSLMWSDTRIRQELEAFARELEAHHLSDG